MNKLTIIGNLTKDPEIRTTQGGHDVCNFTVAVNRRGGNGPDDADFFRVSAWDKLGETCQRFLDKGRKVAVVGPVGARTYQDKNGETRVSLEVTANDVEFLSPKSDSIDPESGFTKVNVGDVLPY